MRISDWSSDVCSSDLVDLWSAKGRLPYDLLEVASRQKDIQYSNRTRAVTNQALQMQKMRQALQRLMTEVPEAARGHPEIQAIAELTTDRSEEHTSELQSLMRISYAVFCLKKKK